MSIEHLDFITSDYESIVFKQQEKINDTETKVRRWDEGVMMMEWNLAKLPAQNSAVLTPQTITGMLGSIAVYAVTGQKCPWMERVCMDMGWQPS